MSEIEKKLNANDAVLSKVKVGDSTYNLKDTQARNDIAAETANRIAADALKVNITESNANGKSQFINENDGGGIFFIADNGKSKSYVGVNDSASGGPDAQIYAINPDDNNKGSKIDVTKEKIYYTPNTTLPYSQRVVADNEIATAGVVDNKIAVETNQREAADTALQVNIDAEESARIAADNLKVNITESNANGKSQFINENDGGGIFFIKDDNTSKSFVGVNDSTAGGPDAQIYAINPSASNAGAKIDILKTGMYYTVGSEPYASRIVESNEIATKGNVSTEAAARANADTALQNSISSEASTRADADTALQTSINTEATTRAAADTALETRIENLEARGRFLSAYNSNTGLPTTYPTVPTGTTSYTYTFKSGDYYIVETAEDGTKYEPTGSSISTEDGGATWTVGKVVSTKEIGVGDYFTFDGTNWVWIQNSQKTVSFSQIAGQPRDNANLKAEIEALEAADTAEATTRAAEDAKKVDRLTTLSDGAKSYVSNNVGDGGSCLKVENSTNYSAVSVNNDVSGGLGAQVYDWKMNGTSYDSGTVIDVTDSKIYYYKGDYQTRNNRDIADNEIATVGVVDTKVAAEASTRATEDAKKVDKQVTGTNGVAYIFNESDGGGAKFENTDGVESFVGVNDGGASGIAAQIYADKLVDGKWQGAKLDVTNGGIYYTVGSQSASERDVAANEIATVGKVTAASDLKLDKASASVAGVVFGADQAITAAELEAADALNLKAMAHAPQAKGSTTLETIDSIEMNSVTVAGNAAVTSTSTVATISQKVDYTPAGTVSTPTITVDDSAKDTFVKSLKDGNDDAASLGAATKSSFAKKILKPAIDPTDSECLIFTWVADDTAAGETGAFSNAVTEQGELSAKKIPVVDATASAVTGVTATSSQPEFSGTKVAQLIPSEITYDKADAAAAFSETVTPTTKTITKTAKTIEIISDPYTPSTSKI